MGYLDWQFKVEEIPKAPTDPVPPKTGDDSHVMVFSTMMAMSISGLPAIALLRKKRKH